MVPGHEIVGTVVAVGSDVKKFKVGDVAGVGCFVDSCGTSDYHIGQTPDKRTQDNAIKHGTDLSHLRGRQFTQSDFDSFDKIFVMDSSNKEDVLALARNNEDKNKVELLLNITHPNNNLGVPDPYFGGANGFEEVYILVDAACEKLSDSLR